MAGVPGWLVADARVAELSVTARVILFGALATRGRGGREIRYRAGLAGLRRALLPGVRVRRAHLLAALRQLDDSEMLGFVPAPWKCSHDIGSPLVVTICVLESEKVSSSGHDDHHGDVSPYFSTAEKSGAAGGCYHGDVSRCRQTSRPGLASSSSDARSSSGSSLCPSSKSSSSSSSSSSSTRIEDTSERKIPVVGTAYASDPTTETEWRAYAEAAERAPEIRHPARFVAWRRRACAHPDDTRDPFWAAARSGQAADERRRLRAELRASRPDADEYGITSSGRICLYGQIPTAELRRLRDPREKL